MYHYRNYLACAVSTIILTFSTKATAQGDFHIKHYEQLTNLSFKAKSKTAAKSNQQTLSFQALGKRFNLELSPNQQLIDALPQTQKRQIGKTLTLYKGNLTNVPGSWVRINQQGNQVSGAIWDGKELYVIDQSDHIIDALGNKKTNPAKKPSTVVYKYSDTESDSTCAIDPHTKPLKSVKGLVSELQARTKLLKAQATRKLDIAVVADAQFSQANKSNPQAAVLERMNVVDGIFAGQVGVKINVTQIKTLTSNGLLTSTSPSTLLTQFSNYVSTSGFNNPGLAHLMTSRDLTGSTVGIAYLSSLCSKKYGIGLSQINGTGVAGALITAHEIGHNFGAPHDHQSGSACATTAGSYLMNPVMNGSKQFSACSLQQMAAMVSKSSACISFNSLNAKATADVRPIVPINPLYSKVSTNFNYRVEVYNNGTAAAQSTTARIALPSSLKVNSVLPSAGQCSWSGTTINCNLGSVPAKTTRIINIGLKSGTAAANLLTVSRVTAANDSTTTNNAINAAIIVR